MNKKSYSFDMETFRNILQICPKLPGQKFVDPLFEEEILTFIRELGYPGNIKLLFDVKVDTLPQPWRTFGTIINKCLSGKVTDIDTLCLSRAQILWGLYHQKNVDYVYLLWEDLVYQIENKEFIPQHEVVQKYSAILPNNLTTQEMKESEAYKTYYAFANGKTIPKPKYVRRSTKEKPEQAFEASFGKRLKATAKVTKSGKKKQPAKGLETLSEIALSEAEHMKLAIERSKTQLHSSQPNGSGAHEGTDDDKRTESDNDGDDFVHPKLSTRDDEARKDDEVNEEESKDESNDESNEESNEEVQRANTEEEEMDEEATHEEDEANELYRDVNVNLEGRDTVMTDSPLPNVQATQETKDTHVILTAPINHEGQQQSSSVSYDFVSNMFNPRPDTSIDSIFTLNTEETSLVDVPVTTIAEPPLVSATNLLPPPTPLITHMQQTPVPTPTTVLSTSLQDLPNFGSLFGFDHRLKTLEIDFSEFKQMNQFAEAVSSILDIIDAYLANKMHEDVKTAIQLQSERLRDEAQAKNKDFLNKLDDKIKKIINDQVKKQVNAQVFKILPKIEKTVNEQLEVEVMTRSSTESKTSLAIVANLSELELKKILIDKIESNKKEPESTSTPKEKTPKSTGKSTERSKSLHKSAGESTHAEEPMHTTKDLEEPAHQEFETGATEDQPFDETPQPSKWFQKPTRLPSPDRDWNKTFLADHGPVQPWLSNLAREEAGPTFELMKGTCKSLVELEYFFKKVYKATTDQLDWNNPEGQQYPHDLRKTLPLIPNSHGRQFIPFDHFINNDLAYLSGGVSSRTYATSVTKTKAVDYGHIKWIEDLVPNTM
ncbi:hypothetical protein Tco_0150981 [Tanacetum coccineum]